MTNNKDLQTSIAVNSGLILAMALITLALITPASAQPPVLQIEVQDVNISPGSSGFVDVLISSPADQLLSLYGAEFRITPLAATSTLTFLEETDAYLSHPSYVFLGNSAAENDGFSSSAGFVFTDTDPNDSFLVGDGTDDFSNVTVNVAQLMARLQVQHGLNGQPAIGTAGDTFSIDLIPQSGDSTDFLFNGTSDTGFVSFGLNPLDDQPVPFDSISGTVTITEPPPVPEPAAAVHALFALLGLLLSWRVGRFARRARRTV